MKFDLGRGDVVGCRSNLQRRIGLLSIPPRIRLRNGTAQALLNTTLKLGLKLKATDDGLYVYQKELTGKPYWKSYTDKAFKELVAKLYAGKKLFYIKGGRRYYIDISKKHTTDELMQWMFISPKTRDAHFFVEAPKGFTCKDKFIELTSEGPNPVDADAQKHRSRIYYDVKFDPAADAPYFREFLGSYFTKDPERAEKQKLILEALAKALTGTATDDGRGFQVWFTGPRQYGKSMLTQGLINLFFPDEFVSHIKPQSWNDKNELLQMVGKLVNYAEECEEMIPVKMTGLIKSITSGHPNSVKKLFFDVDSLCVRGGHFFTSNDALPYKDKSGALQSRCYEIAIDQKYDRPYEEVRNIHRKLRGELAGALNQMVEAYYTIEARENKELIKPKSSQDAEQQQIEESNQLLRFQPKWVEDPTMVTPVWVIYDVFRQQQQAEGEHTWTQGFFEKEFSRMYKHLKVRTPTQRGYRVKFIGDPWIRLSGAPCRYDANEYRVREATN